MNLIQTQLADFKTPARYVTSIWMHFHSRLANRLVINQIHDSTWSHMVYFQTLQIMPYASFGAQISNAFSRADSLDWESEICEVFWASGRETLVRALAPGWSRTANAEHNRIERHRNLPGEHLMDGHFRQSTDTISIPDDSRIVLELMKPHPETPTAFSGQSFFLASPN